MVKLRLAALALLPLLLFSFSFVEEAPAQEAAVDVGTGLNQPRPDASTESTTSEPASVTPTEAQDEASTENSTVTATSGPDASDVADASGQAATPEPVVLDIAKGGPCAQAIADFCSETTSGNGSLVDCLETHVIFNGDQNQDYVLSRECREHISQFRIDQLGGPNNERLARVCAADMPKFCCQGPAVGDRATCMRNLGQDLNRTFKCLRGHREELSKDCRAVVMRMQQEAAWDARLDPDLSFHCAASFEQFCKEVQPVDGQLQKCLWEQIDGSIDVGWNCREQLEKQFAREMDDIRLATALFHTCRADQQQFCSQVMYGNARVMDCLVDNMPKPKFSQQCRSMLRKILRRRVKNFQLNPRLVRVCREAISGICGYREQMQEQYEALGERQLPEGSVINCLQDHRESLNGQCRTEVHRIIATKSADYDLNSRLATDCWVDRSRFCPDVTAGSARVIHCMMENRKDLSPGCSASLFDLETRMAASIDFQYPLKAACASDITHFCADMDASHARVLRCLMGHMEEAAMTQECKQQLQKEQQREGTDYRLNYRLSKACAGDVEALCGEKCDEEAGGPCGGAVLECLVDMQDQIASPECKEEVFYFVRMEVTDYRNDIITAEDCRADVDKFCADVPPGNGRVHTCLWKHLKDVSENCRKAEVQLKVAQGRDVRLLPGLIRACQAEMQLFCSSVKPGNGAVLRCLEHNLGQVEMGGSCRMEVEGRLQLAERNFEYDAPLQKQCRADIRQYCAAEVARAHGKAQVLLCLINTAAELSEGCAAELKQLVRMALWTYQPGTALTAACDADVKERCGDVKVSPGRKAFSMGAVGRCLSRHVASGGELSDDGCKKLVMMSAPKEVEDMYKQGKANAMDTKEIMSMLQGMEDRLGLAEGTLVKNAESGDRMLSLTAMMSMGILLLLILAAGLLVAFGGRLCGASSGGLWTVYKAVPSSAPKNGDI